MGDNQLINGQYLLVREIDRGGSATVYFGIDQFRGFPVAIKIPHPSRFTDSAARRQFRLEANLYLQLQHPNIVQLTDLYIQNDTTYYLIMDYVDGLTLNKYIAQKTGPIPEGKAKNFMLQILQGIGYAHQKKVVHRDIKPNNVMITNSDEKIKVLDFGIAIPEKQKQQSKIEGTPMYMSPEQIDSVHIDHRSDIYSLGVTLHQMLTGKLPYQPNSTRREVFDKIKTEKLPRAISLYPFVSEGMQRIIDKATEKNPEKRFQSCNEFAEALAKL